MYESQSRTYPLDTCTLHCQVCGAQLNTDYSCPNGCSIYYSYPYNFISYEPASVLAELLEKKENQVVQVLALLVEIKATFDNGGDGLDWEEKLDKAIGILTGKE